jgi:transposase InsO family protein
LYLAIVLDLFSRRVVGWSMSEGLDRELALDALKMALAVRQPARDMVHHSDRGSQYASLEYQRLLAEHEIIGSMSRAGTVRTMWSQRAFLPPLSSNSSIKLDGGPGLRRAAKSSNILNSSRTAVDAIPQLTICLLTSSSSTIVIYWAA